VASYLVIYDAGSITGGIITMVTIAATVYVNEGKGAELENEFLQLQAKVLKEPGTIAYALHRSSDDPCKYFVYEKYENDEALKFHTSTEHFKTFFQKMGTFVKGQPEVGFYQEVK
jgi:quinol monooxygenase YgiN